jgi:hypothetical protein
MPSETTHCYVIDVASGSPTKILGNRKDLPGEVVGLFVVLVKRERDESSVGEAEDENAQLDQADGFLRLGKLDVGSVPT